MQWSGTMYASRTVVPVLCHAVKLPRRNEELPGIYPGMASTYSSFDLGELRARLTRAQRYVAHIPCNKRACTHPIRRLVEYSARFAFGYSHPANLSRALVGRARGLAGECVRGVVKSADIVGARGMDILCLFIPYCEVASDRHAHF